MPITPGVRPFIIDTVIDALKAEFGDSFKAYYFGDPIDIPAEYLPALIVSKEDGDIGPGPTGMDDNSEAISIQVVLNKKDQLGNPALEFTAHRKLMELIEGRSADTGQYLSNSIMGVLRTNFTLGNVINDQTVSIEYTTDIRNADGFTEEGKVKISVSELVQVNNRS